MVFGLVTPALADNTVRIKELDDEGKNLTILYSQYQDKIKQIENRVHEISGAIHELQDQDIKATEAAEALKNKK